MRKIKLKEWETKGSDIKGNLVLVLRSFIAQMKPDKLPTGFEQFRFFNKLNKAFEAADETKVLELEEYEYSNLKKLIDGSIQSVWGMTSEVGDAIIEFMECEAEKPDKQNDKKKD